MNRERAVKATGLFVVVLAAPTNKIEDLLPRLPGALEPSPARSLATSCV